MIDSKKAFILSFIYWERHDERIRGVLFHLVILDAEETKSISNQSYYLLYPNTLYDIVWYTLDGISTSMSGSTCIRISLDNEFQYKR